MFAGENGSFLFERKVKKDWLVGNGKLLVYAENADIVSFHGCTYTSPSFIGIRCDFNGEEHKSISIRNAYTSTYVHKLYECGGVKTPRKLDKRVEDARIIDVMHPKYPVFVRYCENIIPFRMNLMIPSYVRKAVNERYKIDHKYYSVLSLVMPSGVSFYKNGATCSETRMLVIVDGDARFTSDGNAVEILTGASRVIFVAGDGRSCIEHAKFALEDISYFSGHPKIVSDSEAFWKNEFSRSNIKYDHRDTEILEEALFALVSQQTEEGGVVSGFAEPVIRTDSAEDIVSAFLKVGLYDRAKSVLEFFCKKFALHGEFYQVYGTLDRHFERYFSDSSLGCANLIKAFISYADKTGDNEFVKENFAMLKKAMYLQAKEMAVGMMPFSGCEVEISDEILGPGVQLQGSLESTVAAYSSFVSIIEFCDKHSLKLQNDNGSSARRADELIDSITRYFIKGDKVAFNVPVREKNIKRRRFAYGDCDICRMNLYHVYYGELELAPCGVYMCPKCLSYRSDMEVFDRLPLFLPQATALLLSERRIADKLGRKTAMKLFEAALSERNTNEFVRTVRSDTYFLEIAKYLDREEYQKQFCDYIKSDLEKWAYPRTVSYNIAKGKFDTRTIARIISALI